MATIRAYTTIEQSRKLAGILPLESADMIWYGIYRGMDGEHHLLSDEYNEFGLIAINKEFCKTLFRIGDEYVDWLPCWSIAALLSILPKYEIYNNGKTIQLDVNLEALETEGDETLLDLVVNMIIHLYEQKLL